MIIYVFANLSPFFAKKIWGQKKAQFRYFFLLCFNTNELFYCYFNNEWLDWI